MGKDEKEKSWSVPSKPQSVRFILTTLPASLQDIPYHLHGLTSDPGLIIQEERREEWLWLWRVAFHLSRACASSLEETWREQEQIKIPNWIRSRETWDNIFCKAVEDAIVCFS